MIITKTLDKNAKPTPEQIEMLEKAMSLPIEPDEDCPAYSYEELKRKVEYTARRKAEKSNGEDITIRLSTAVANKAKSLGTGYTNVLARLIENGLNDPELLKKAL